MDRLEQKGLELTAGRCRRNVLRMIEAGHHGHMGGAMSCIDIVTYLYFKGMKVDPRNPEWEDRDRFLLSAGHKCMAQYAVLAEKGYFAKEVLDTYGSLHSYIPGHPDMHKLAGIEANTGALGHGLSIATGMALGLKNSGKEARVYAVMGDGELAEGSNWEAAAAAAHHNADNLVVFVDFNGLQISGRVQDVMNMTPISEKFRAFGWNVQEIDGNNMREIDVALKMTVTNHQNKPSAIIAHTVKSKGISFAENKAQYHFWTPKQEEFETAVREVEANIQRLEKEVQRLCQN